MPKRWCRKHEEFYEGDCVKCAGKPGSIRSKQRQRAKRERIKNRAPDDQTRERCLVINHIECLAWDKDIGPSTRAILLQLKREIADGDHWK